MAAFLGDLMLSFHRVFVFHATDSGPVPLSNFLTHYNISQRNHSVTMVVGCLWEMSKNLQMTCLPYGALWGLFLWNIFFWVRE